MVDLRSFPIGRLQLRNEHSEISKDYIPLDYLQESAEGRSKLFTNLSFHA
jgi:hypothetical protein